MNTRAVHEYIFLVAKSSNFSNVFLTRDEELVGGDDARPGWPLCRNLQL